MKDVNSSSAEVTYRIRRPVEKYKKRILFVPFGYPFNFDFMEKADSGDLIELEDGIVVRIISKTIVNMGSSVADVLAQALYGKPMHDVYLDFVDEFGEDNIQNEEVVVIAYEFV